MDAAGYKYEFSVAPILQKKNQKFFFKNDLNILIIQIYIHVIPLFQGMTLYFKAKKNLIYL